MGGLKMKSISTEWQAKNAEKGRYRVVAPGVANLYFKKTSDTVGAGSFVSRYWHNGKRRYMGLGPLSSISLAKACKRAKELAVERNEGVDPIEERRRKQAEERAKLEPVNFIQATEVHLKAHAPSWKHRRARQVWLNPIARYAYPIIGRLWVNDIMPEHIAAVLRAAIKAGAPEAGKRVRARIEAVLDGCIAKGERDPVRGNPANARLIAAIVPSKRKSGDGPHFRRIDELDDGPGVFQRLEALAGAKNSAAIDAWPFVILTGARPGEALGCKWGEIDLDKRLWTLPAVRAKTGRQHIVPLSEAAIKVLERRRKVGASDMVFAGRSGSAVGYRNFARAPMKAGIDAGTPHSWRSIFRDWAGDIGRIDRDLAEAALAHSLGPTEGAYRRQTAVEARRPVMEAYAKWLCGDAGADLIAFPTRA
jgi:integrase